MSFISYINTCGYPTIAINIISKTGSLRYSHPPPPCCNVNGRHLLRNGQDLQDDDEEMFDDDSNPTEYQYRYPTDVAPRAPFHLLSFTTSALTPTLPRLHEWQYD